MLIRMRSPTRTLQWPLVDDAGALEHQDTVDELLPGFGL